MGSLTKTYIFYLVWGLDCDRVSKLHCGLPVGSVGVRLLSIIVPEIDDYKYCRSKGDGRDCGSSETRRQLIGYRTNRVGGLWRCVAEATSLARV